MDDKQRIEFALMQKAVAEHEEAIKSQGELLENISKTLLQLKWLAIGAIGFMCVDVFGLLNVLKIVIK